MRKTRFGRGKRVIATLGAAALGLIGLAGVANADAPNIANIDPDAEGSITLFKFGRLADEEAWGLPADGKEIASPPDHLEPLEGVRFDFVPVTAVGTDTIDLTTPEGWDLIQGLDAAVIDAALHGGTPGYTFGTAIEKTTDADGKAETGDIALGLYLVHEISSGNNPVREPVAPFLVSLPYPDATDSSWIYDVFVYPKNVTCDCETEKEVMEPGQVVQADGTVVDDEAEVDWLVRVPLSGHSEDGINNFSIVDILDPRLEFKPGSVVFKTFDGTISEGEPVSNTLDLNTHYTVAWDALANTLTVDAINPAGTDALSDGVTYVEITFTTFVDGAGIIPNTVTSIVNEWTSTVGEEPNDNPPPNTNWAPVEILKVEDVGDPALGLQGAEFEIYQNVVVDGEDTPDLTKQVGGTYVTGPDGKISVVLWVGNNDEVGPTTYWFLETKAPPGYILPEGDDAWTAVAVTASEDEDGEPVVITQSIENTQHEGPELPLTGANGQLLMMLGGIGIVLAGLGAATVARRRGRDAGVDA